MSLAAKVATGGILAVIGLMVVKFLFVFLSGLLGFLAVAFKIALVVLVIWVVLRLFRRPRTESV